MSIDEWVWQANTLLYDDSSRNRNSVYPFTVRVLHLKTSNLVLPKQGKALLARKISGHHPTVLTASYHGSYFIASQCVRRLAGQS